MVVTADQTWEFEGLRLDLSARTLLGRLGEEIPLRRSEYELLRAFVTHAGRALSRDFLLDAVAGRQSEPYDRSIDVLVGRLRRKIEPEPNAPRILLTVPGVGYRFSAKLEAVKTAPAPVSMPDLSIAQAPRLSLVVLPFANLSGNDKEGYLADAVTEDLTTELSYLPGAMVIAGHSAAVYKGRAVDAKRVGDELGVRYVVEGSVRKLGELLRINVQLISTETNSHIWAARFDQNLKDLGAGQEEIVGRLSSALGIQLFGDESARSARERPDSPDVKDLLLRAWSTWRKGPDPSHRLQAIEMYERALRLDPRSIQALCRLADEMINRFVIPEYPSRGDENLMERFAKLISDAMAIAPQSERVMFEEALLRRAQGDAAEALAIFNRVAELYPNSPGIDRQRGFLELAVGQADKAIGSLQRSIRVDPLSPFNRHTYQRLGLALLLLGRESESIEWLDRALALGGMAPSEWRAQCHLHMASAFALMGRVEDASRVLFEANRLWPFATVRSLPPTMSPRGLPHPTYVAQMRRAQEGLRLAGLRDHADGDADFGIAPDDVLHDESVGLTPIAVPGATTIRTQELFKMWKRSRPLLIDVAQDSWGQSIPGAVGLQGVGHGAAFSKSIENRFSRKLRDLTGGDLSAPIVAFCVNSERFTGYNLTLRLVALGYTHVLWYRGGVEAWQVGGFPESDLDLQSW